MKTTKTIISSCLFLAVLFLCISCEDEKPPYVEGNYSGEMTLGDDSGPLFIVLRLGELKKDQKFTSPEGVVINSTDIWSIEGSLSGNELNNASITGQYVIKWQKPVFIETSRMNDRVLSLNGEFEYGNANRLYGECELKIYEGETVKESRTGSFSVEK